MSDKRDTCVKCAIHKLHIAQKEALIAKLMRSNEELYKKLIELRGAVDDHVLLNSMPSSNELH